MIQTSATATRGSDRSWSGGDLVRTFRAMATDVTIRVVRPRSPAEASINRAEQVFHRVESTCTRFNPTSPLMVANAAPSRWHEVPVELFLAIEAAFLAYRETSGRFDPRVLRVLESWGYDRSLAFEQGAVDVRPGQAPAPAPAAPGRRRWLPRFDHKRHAVRLGAQPIDLGGIGKGLAVRWAATELAGAGDAALVEAGGDLYAAGSGPEGTGWRVAVEDPRASGPADPVAVLAIRDLACATSSVRIRHWRVGGRNVHHLVDPRTGAAGGAGLLSVTVVDPDPAHAEVWSKALFLAGRGQVRRLADERGIAALLVDSDGVVGTSAAMKEQLIWQAPRAW